MAPGFAYVDESREITLADTAQRWLKKERFLVATLLGMTPLLLSS
jgi:hypothetical protein